MKEVFSDPDSTRVAFYKTILDQAQITNFLRNEFAANSLAVPTPDMFEALCVEDADYDAAMILVHDAQNAPQTSSADWRCLECGESVPGNFSACWKCEAARPVAAI